MTADCRKNFERISEYLDGELGPDACRQLEQHLKQCPECRNCFDALKKTVSLCKKSSREEIPGEMRERLRMKLKDCFDRRLPSGQ